MILDWKKKKNEKKKNSKKISKFNLFKNLLCLMKIAYIIIWFRIKIIIRYYFPVWKLRI